jgi:predicted secreted protein
MTTMGRALARAFVAMLAATAASGMAPSHTKISVPSDMSPLTPAADEPVIVLDESTTATATVTVGGRVQIRLRAQFGTGYSWALQSSPPTLKSRTDQIEQTGGPPRDGGSDIQVFSFEAASSGTARLDFVYRRPFAPNDPSAKHATFEIRIVAR